MIQSFVSSRNAFLTLVAIFMFSCVRDAPLDTQELTTLENKTIDLEQAILDEYTPGKTGSSNNPIVEKKNLNVVDYYMILVSNGYIKEIYSEVDSKGIVDIRAFVRNNNGHFGRSENEQFHSVLGVSSRTLSLLSQMVTKLQRSGVTYDEGALATSVEKLHKLGLIDRSVVPAASTARTSFWKYAKIVVGSAVKMSACSLGPVGCGLAIVSIGIDIADFACEIHGC